MCKKNYQWIKKHRKKLIEYYKSIYEGANIKIQSCNLKEQIVFVFYNTYITQNYFVNMIQDVADKMKNTDANFIVMSYRNQQETSVLSMKLN